MKLIAVKLKLDHAHGKDQWRSECCICHEATMSDDLKGAITAARRHIKECDSPQLQHSMRVLTKPWKFWIIGFM